MVSTNDLYEATYYLMNGCELVSLDGMRVNGKVTCRMNLEGGELARLQLLYLQGEAHVNLIDFRRAFGHVYNIAHKEKTRCKKVLKNGGAL